MSFRRSSRFRILGIVIAGFGLLLGSGVVAHADEFPASIPPDANPHGFCYGSGVGDDARENIHAAEWNALDPTAANVNHDSVCDLASSSETDVVWHVGELAGERLGRTMCEDIDDFWCDQYYVRLDMQRLRNAFSQPEIAQTIVACHELGHTVALDEGPDREDCMRTDLNFDPPDDLKFRRYSDHHKGHIADWFCCLAPSPLSAARRDVSGSAIEQNVDSSTETVDLMRDTVLNTYLPYPDPGAMLKAVDLAMAGTVVPVEPALVSDSMENYGAVVVGIRPVEVWKDEPDRAGDLVYFYFERPTNLDIGPYRAGLPAGTELALFGFDWSQKMTFAKGDPGATIYATAPQGLFIPNSNEELMNVWGNNSWPQIHTIDDLSAALGQ